MDCHVCGKPLKQGCRSWSKYCSKSCNHVASRERYKHLNRSLGLPSGTTGAIAELRVAVDLMSRGFEVFRALSPSASCDLAIISNDHLLRVEVRTSYYGVKDGTITKNKSGVGNQDIWAFVTHDKITYEPDLPERTGPARCRSHAAG